MSVRKRYDYILSLFEIFQISDYKTKHMLLCFLPTMLELEPAGPWLHAANKSGTIHKLRCKYTTKMPNYQAIRHFFVITAKKSYGIVLSFLQSYNLSIGERKSCQCRFLPVL